jgi:hypothetical protein
MHPLDSPSGSRPRAVDEQDHWSGWISDVLATEFDPVGLNESLAARHDGLP